MFEAQQSHALAALSQLPFTVVANKRARSLWKVTPSGDYSQDCETGSLYANALIDYIRSENNPTILGMIAMDMGRSERSGIEVGFFHRIGVELLSQ